MKERIVEVEPLGTEIVLPAIVVGYELTGAAEAVVRALPDDVPGWLWLVAQQAGGLSMSYPVVLGVILRLEASEAWRGDGAFLIRGLKAMAEDADVRLLRREYPILAELVSTHGGDYAAPARERLRGFLAGFLRLPAIAGGLEAFIRFERCELLEYFAGWRMLQYELPAGGVGKIYAVDDGIAHVDQSNLCELVLGEQEVLAAGHLDALRSFGAAAGLAGEPSAFLLWENSD